MTPRMNLLTGMKARPTPEMIFITTSNPKLATDWRGGTEEEGGGGGGGFLGEMHPYAACGPNPAAILKGQIAIILSHH